MELRHLSLWKLSWLINILLKSTSTYGKETMTFLQICAQFSRVYRLASLYLHSALCNRAFRKFAAYFLAGQLLKRCKWIQQCAQNRLEFLYPHPSMHCLLPKIRPPNPPLTVCCSGIIWLWTVLSEPRSLVLTPCWWLWFCQWNIAGLHSNWFVFSHRIWFVNQVLS